MEKVRFVCATRASAEDFATKTALGKSLALYHFYPFVELKLAANNSKGLPELYNQAIDEARDDPAVLVFIHDDVHLSDFYWADQLFNGLEYFQILGVAGNKRRVPKQPAWCFLDTDFKRDHGDNLSGVVGHGSGFPCESFNVFGPPCQEVKLLDGVLLAARSSTLIDRQIRFDPAFPFHFYDLDFCRQAELHGAKMGTWSLSVIHESHGNFDSPSWRQGYANYLAKYGD